MTPTTITVDREVPFSDTEARPLSLDVYTSEASGPRPSVLFVYGGGFVEGDTGQLARQALDYAAEGYVAVEFQYRLGGERGFPAALIDVKAAIEWLRVEGPSYGVDPNRIAVVGHSAGGNLATLAAATADDPGLEPDVYPGTSSAVDAAVGYAGVYDLVPWAENPDENVRSYLGRDRERRLEAAELASPIAQADAAMPPTLLMHGMDDTVVDPEQAELFYETLDAVTTAEMDLLEGDGADHLFPHHAATYEDVKARTLTFLDRYL